MTAAVSQILEAVEKVSARERAELMDRIAKTFPCEEESEIVEAQICEVRRRIADVESGKVKLVPSEEVFAQADVILADARARVVSDAWLVELDRRIAQAESGEVAPIQGEDAMAHIRRLDAGSVARKNGE